MANVEPSTTIAASGCIDRGSPISCFIRRKYIRGAQKINHRALRLDPLIARLRSVPRLAWLVGALLVGTALRLPGLGQQSLWVDEGNTYIRAILPLDIVLENLLEVHNQVPLYYLLNRLALQVFGSSEFALRLLSVYSGLLNVPFVYLLGRLSGRCWVGLLAAWMMALNPFHVWYSRDARMYSLGVLLVSGAVWCFLLALRYGGWRRWAAFAMVNGMAYLTHYATLGVGLVQLVVFLLTFRKTYRAFRWWVFAQIVAVMPAASWLALSMISYGYSGIRGNWIPMPSLLAPAKTFWNFSLGYDGHLGVWTTSALLVFAAVLWAGMWRRSEPTWDCSMIAWLLVLPSMALGFSFVLGPVYVDRYLSVCVPAYLLLLSAGLSAFPTYELRLVLAGLLCIAMTISALGITNGKRIPKPEWQQATKIVVEAARNGDQLLVDQKGLFLTFYYVGEALPITGLDVESADVQLDKALRQCTRTWFLYRDPTESPHRLAQTKPFDPRASGSPQIANWLRNHADQVEREWELKGVFLALLKPYGPGSDSCDK